MSFFDKMQNELNDAKTLTTNGAVAYETSGKHLLDFNFGIVGYRNAGESKITKDFSRAFYEDKLHAMKELFFVGDVREGLGERRTFRVCMKDLIVAQPEIAKATMKLVPHFNRWDSLLIFLDNCATRKEAIELIREQLTSDLKQFKEGKPISLCAKWMPSINASSTETRRYANILREGLGWTCAKYRKTLSKLRNHLDVVEVKMSAKRWNEIRYDAVPSRANLLYNSAFLRNDEERRREYLGALASGKTKINSGVLYPHEIVKKYPVYGGMDTTLEELWKALPNLMVDNCLVIRDGSGSMAYGNCGGAKPIDVATALAIYMSEHNTGEWKDKFITFSAKPKIVNLENCKTLREKIAVCDRDNDWSNTDIYKTMMLILSTAINNRISLEEMPKLIVICSDMQFDGRMFHLNQSLFDDIARQYEASGYLMPKICFWNLNASVSKTVPMQKNKLGLILCSGFSVQILKMFMSGEVDPYKVLLETLDSERYKIVGEVLEGLI